jgi:hypothetical protein
MKQKRKYTPRENPPLNVGKNYITDYIGKCLINTNEVSEIDAIRHSIDTIRKCIKSKKSI